MFREEKRKLNMKMLLVDIGLILFAVIGLFILYDAHTPDPIDIELPDGYEKGYVHVRVEEGDTLYGIAGEYCNLDIYKDYRRWINEVISINDLHSEDIYTDQELIVPVVHLEGDGL